MIIHGQTLDCFFGGVGLWKLDMVRGIDRRRLRQAMARWEWSKQRPRRGANWPRDQVRWMGKRGRVLAVGLSLCLGAGVMWGGDQPERVSFASRPFSIEHRNGCAWLVRPSGERFFSFGVCCVDQGTPRARFNRANPSYAAWQHYSSTADWAATTLKRLRSWGVTTLGGWGDFAALRAGPEAGLAFTPVLHVGSTAGAPWWDMWDEQIMGRMEQVAREQILAFRDDPRLLGYYSDNELGWWNGALLRMTLEQPATSGQRQRLLELLRQTYRQDWNALLADFEPEGAGTWAELEQRGKLYLRPGSQGIHTLRRFLALIAERYYALVQQIIRKYDRRALILGDRYQSFYYPEVARASAPYVDAVSGNLNASWNDGAFTRFYLDTLHALTGKPIVVSEFYLAARENRSGNRNDRGVFPVAATQAERVAGFRTTLDALLRLPYVIGADWFQYYDEPRHGREDGENFNFGLVDIHDRPYRPLTAAAAGFDLMTRRGEPRPPRLDASQGVPRAPRGPLDHFTQSTLALKHWDRERGFVRPVSDFPLADLYLCWDEGAIYLGVYAQDVVEDELYRDRRVPEVDRAELSVVVGERRQPIRARLGAGRPPVVDEPAVRIAGLSGVNLGVRNIAALRLPARLFNQQRFRPGDTITLATTLFTHARAYSVQWRGAFTLRGAAYADGNER